MSSSRRRKLLGLALCEVLFLSALTLGRAASALTLGGFTFELGEKAFADDGLLVSGTIRWWCGTGTSIQGSISGSDLSDCLNNDTGNSGIVEVLFVDNTIVNGPGTDLVIFELSGHLEPGTPDPRERFGVSIFDGSSFSSFVEFNPIATGIESFPGALDIFVVEIDLTNFGLAGGAETQRVRLHIFDVGLGTKSADIGALGALNSNPVPEPTVAVLVLLGVTGLLLRWRAAALDRAGEAVSPA